MEVRKQPRCERKFQNQALHPSTQLAASTTVCETDVTPKCRWAQPEPAAGSPLEHTTHVRRVFNQPLHPADHSANKYPSPRIQAAPCASLALSGWTGPCSNSSSWRFCAPLTSTAEGTSQDWSFSCCAQGHDSHGTKNRLTSLPLSL